MTDQGIVSHLDIWNVDIIYKVRLQVKRNGKVILSFYDVTTMTYGT